MTNQPSANVKLSDEQLRQIDAFDKRIKSLQLEIDSSTSILTSTRLESERFTKEKEYQQELLDIIEKNIHKKTIELETLDKEINLKQEEFSLLTEQSRIKSIEHNDKHQELVSREKKLQESKKQHQLEQEEFLKEKEELQKEKQKIIKSKELLISIIKSLPWKSEAE